jgi:hypothetical protein
VRSRSILPRLKDWLFSGDCSPIGNRQKCSSDSSNFVSSADSDLEAFSHFPTRDSFAALPFQATALPIARSNGSSRTKLHCYYEVKPTVG